MSTALESEHVSYGIKGMISSSMLDWDGKLAAVLFSGGCNLKCPFCHNVDLVLNADKMDEYPWARIEYHLNSKRDWLDGVCISGGEPTLNPHLEDLARLIRDMGFEIKLDTNGTRPENIARLIEKGFVDYVAVDIKTDFDKYARVAGERKAGDNVKRTIELLVSADESGSVKTEFRTTVVPKIVDREDLLSIASHLSKMGVRRYALQQFNPKNVLDPQANEINPHSKEYLCELARECSKYLPTKVR